MNKAMLSIIKKDFRGVTNNKRLFSAMLILPLILTLILPSIFILTIHFAPDDPDIIKMLELFPESLGSENIEIKVIIILFYFIMPVFFLMIPVMAASIMSASAFVGEKERHTLETLLYCPLTLKQIFQSKVLASFILSMLVSVLSFVAMLLTIEIEIYFISGILIAPSISWLIIMLIVSPAVSLIAITLIVRGSAKAKSVDESQQSAVFMIIPIILLLVGQFTGVLFMSTWISLGIGLVCSLIAWLLLKKSMARFTYEKLLK